jgi:glutamyl-tRNA synthetase
MMRKSDEELAVAFNEVIRDKGFEVPFDKVVKLTSLVRERADFVRDLWDQSDFFFVAPEQYDPEVVRKRWTPDSPAQISGLTELLGGMPDFTSSALEAMVKKWIADKGYNTGTLLNLFRLLLVGTSRGPHLFDIAEWIGREETLNRLKKGLKKLSS